jgi:hypothetical protein
VPEATRTVATSPRELAQQVIDARNTRAIEQLESLLDRGVRYWDPVVGELSGRSTVIAHFAHTFERFPDECLWIATLVADGTHAVAELAGRATCLGCSADFVQTESYEADSGTVSVLRSYFDPAVHPHGTVRPPGEDANGEC